LNLRNNSLDGVDLTTLAASEEPLTRAPSRANSPERSQGNPVPPSLEERLANVGLSVEEARQLLEQAHSSATEREGRPPRRHPRGTGDDPFSLGDIDQPEDRSGGRLEGIPPKPYDGDRAQTHYFFSQFKRFVLMNKEAKLIKDPISRCAYFLSLIDGDKVKGWVQRQLNWLDRVEERDEILPWNMNAWDVLQREFKKAFVDYAEHERAYNGLRVLKMKDGDVDGFIYTFEELARRSGVNPNEPTVTRMFARGLPKGLAESCIDQDSPESFEQWTNSAQRQQKNWMKKRSLHEENERPPREGQRTGQGRSNLPPW
jgi:hypothetical protein